MKFELRDFTPFQLGAARYLFAVLPLVFFISRPQLSWRWMLASGFAQLSQFALLFMVLQIGMTAALASVLMQTQGVFYHAAWFLFCCTNVSAYPCALGWLWRHWAWHVSRRTP